MIGRVNRPLLTVILADEESEGCDCKVFLPWLLISIDLEIYQWTDNLELRLSELYLQVLYNVLYMQDKYSMLFYNNVSPRK